MAGRILNRHELGKRTGHAEQTGSDPSPAATAAAPKKRIKKEGPVLCEVKKPRKAKTPPRLRARWGVFDGSMKQVAIFDHNQRAAADEKLAHLLANKNGIHFLQMVKELILEVPSVEAPTHA